MTIHDKIARIFRTDKKIIRIFLAEFIGTFFLVLVGDGSVAQMLISGSSSYLSVNLAYGLAIAFGVYICGNVSGGHINPAITLAFAIIGNVKWIYVPAYFLAQYLGAFCAALSVYGIYYDGFHQVLLRNNVTLNGAGVLATLPSDYFSIPTALADQVVGTAILSCCVMALTDKRNANVAQGLVPLLVGLVVAMIGMSYGILAGFAINPARDLAPRIAAAMIPQFGDGVFKIKDYKYFWIPVIGPHIGAIVGCFIYKLFISLHWEENDNDEDEQNEERRRLKRSEE